MTSIRQTKKYGKKLVAKGFILILGKQRNRHYTRVYKRFHASVKKRLSVMRTRTIWKGGCDEC